MIYLDTSVALAHLLAEDRRPQPVRTLDALHLASIAYLRQQGQEVELATFDRRMASAAHAMGIRLSDLTGT